MEYVVLDDLVCPTSTWSPRKSRDPGIFTYIDVGSVDSYLKEIGNARAIPNFDAPSRARQLVQAGDVLVSTVRPNLNAVARVPPSLNGATASTGLCVLRPNEKIDSDYLFNWVKSPQFVLDMTNKSTGQSYPAVSDKIIRASLVPLPPVDQQKRTAAVLDKVDALRAKRREALALLDELAESVFLDMFGDPATNTKAWPWEKVGGLIGSASYGSSAKAALQGSIPVLRMNNITYSGEIDLSDLKYLDEASVSERHLAHSGDVLFNRTNSAELVGKTAVYRGASPIAYAGYLVRLRANEITHPEYLSAFLNSRYCKLVLRNMCKSIIGMANINAREVQTIRIMQPPYALQEKFADRLAAINSLKSTHRTHLAHLDELFASLQQRAFRGDLWPDSATAPEPAQST